MKDERFDLIPIGALTQLARHYGVGARKYDDNQWRQGYEYSKSYAALVRHLTQWWGGEDIDEETGSSHLAAVAWHAFTMMTFQADGTGVDDRYRKPTKFKLDPPPWTEMDVPTTLPEYAEWDADLARRMLFGSSSTGVSDRPTIVQQFFNGLRDDAEEDERPFEDYPEWDEEKRDVGPTVHVHLDSPPYAVGDKVNVYPVVYNSIGTIRLADVGEEPIGYIVENLGQPPFTVDSEGVASR